MRPSCISLCLSALLLCASSALAEPLPRSAPEAQGLSSAAISEFIQAADERIDSLHSFMLVRHGSVVAEGWWAPYQPDQVHELYSLSKSFTSTAVGFAVKEGRMSVDDTVVSFFPDLLPENPSANLKSMRVRDLLAMCTGHDKEPAIGRDGMTVKAFLAHPVAFKPGTHFLYNTPATFMCSAIVQKVTGQTILEYLKTRLFQPLGIEGAEWGTNSEGISLGGYGLSVRTEDIAKFGQFYLQKGRWNGEQLLPVSWIEAASSRQTSNGSNPKSDWDQGYGYQFWRCRNGAYRGDGAFGQYCIVMPEQDAVIAITSGLGDMQAVMNLVWDKLLPAMKSGSMAEDPASLSRLKQQLAGLSLKAPAGSSSSSSSERLAGKRFIFEGDAQVDAITVGQDSLEVHGKGGSLKILMGDYKWTHASAPLNMPLSTAAETPIATAAAWTDGSTLEGKTVFTATPYVQTWTLKFDGQKVTLDRENNVSFGPRKSPQIVGRLE